MQTAQTWGILPHQARWNVTLDQCRPGRLPLMEKRYRYSSVGVVLSGSFRYVGDHGLGTAVPGTLLLGNAGEHFYCEHDSAAGNRRQVVHFEANYLLEWACEFGVAEGRFRAGVIPPGPVASAALGHMRRLECKDEEAVCNLAALTLQIDRSCFAPRRLRAESRDRILAVVDHLQAHYAQSWNLRSLAMLAGLSRFHFLRVFKQVTGQSPAQYVLHTRLRVAGAMLLKSSMPITQVAGDVGFNDLSHFNASFRRVFGASPGTYRRAARRGSTVRAGAVV